MIFEIEFEIRGNINLTNGNILVRKHPYLIKIFNKEEKNYISISKKIFEDSACLPKVVNGSSTNAIKVILPKEESYADILELVQHIESFGALDNKFKGINTNNITLVWIPESDQDHFSPLRSVKRNRVESIDPSPLTKNWLQGTVFHKNQLEDLFIPFAFYRERLNLFYDTKYQASFCSFYMMLEFFFHDKSWGIEKDAYKTKACLGSSLNKVLNEINKYQTHCNWLSQELANRNKSYDEEGLLFVINRFRDELSHAVDKTKNRNIFNDSSFFSLAFIMLQLCFFVTVKKRFLPFVQPNNRDNFMQK